MDDEDEILEVLFKSFLQRIFDRIPIGLYRTSPSGEIIHANPAIVSMLGYASIEELKKRNLEVEGYEPSYPRADFKKRIEKEGSIHGLEARWQRVDGEIIDVREYADLVRGENGEILYYDGVVEDISEFRNAERTIFKQEKELELEQEKSKKALEEAFASLRSTQEGTLRVMAKLVETRDPYTSGHQERVARLAVAIAADLGLDEEEREGLRVASLVHDIGKLRVPIEILSKPGQLTDIEMDLIRNHPQAGFDLMSEISFPWPVGKMILQHHERLDGSGYPGGLCGDEILPEARIIAVADVVEAMSADRPYRPYLGVDSALNVIRAGSGSLFDPEVASVCIDLFESGRFSF